MQFQPSLSGTSHNVCCLHHSLYGHKKVPRAWFEKFRQALLHLHSQQSQYDTFMFFQRTTSSATVFLGHVDDIIITRTDSMTIRQLQDSLHVSFHMKDLGPRLFPWP